MFLIATSLRSRRSRPITPPRVVLKLRQSPDGSRARGYDRAGPASGGSGPAGLRTDRAGRRDRVRLSPDRTDRSQRAMDPPRTIALRVGREDLVEDPLHLRRGLDPEFVDHPLAQPVEQLQG